jgi:hypothetical protein
MATNLQLIDAAMRLIDANTVYRLAVEVPLTADTFALELSNPGAITPKPAFDCSEYTQIIAWHCGVTAPDGAHQQMVWCQAARTIIPIGQGVRTPGALLGIDFGPGGAGGNGNHVAISLGNGTSIEARSTHATPQVGIHSAYGRGWSWAALMPNITYLDKPKEGNMQFRLIRLYGWYDARLITQYGVIVPPPGGTGLQWLCDNGWIERPPTAQGNSWDQFVFIIGDRESWNILTAYTPTTALSGEPNPL